MYKSLIAAVLLSTTLAGCIIQNDGQRALVGAGAGALAADALGYDPITGAALGAGAGALCGQAGVGICQN
jgi:osmotically inducible lipoprotein OsmB